MKTILLSVFLIFISNTVSAQNLEFNIEKAMSKIENHMESIKLNDDQKAQFKEINEKYRLKLESIKNSDKTRFVKFQELKKLINEKDQEIKLLLNKEQFKKYKLYQKENKNKIRDAFQMRNNNYFYFMN